MLLIVCIGQYRYESLRSVSEVDLDVHYGGFESREKWSL